MTRHSSFCLQELQRSYEFSDFDLNTIKKIELHLDGWKLIYADNKRWRMEGFETENKEDKVYKNIQ
jgi:hypothetical protein